MKDKAAVFVWRHDAFGREEGMKAGEEPGRARRPVVIAVDDDPSLREALAAVLGQRFEMITLSSGDGLLSTIEAYQPDLVMLDVNLPGKDGFALCRSVRSSPKFRRLPVLFLTVLRDDESLASSVNANADAYISKPFKPRELMETVDRLIACSRS